MYILYSPILNVDCAIACTLRSGGLWGWLLLSLLGRVCLGVVWPGLFGWAVLCFRVCGGWVLFVCSCLMSCALGQYEVIVCMHHPEERSKPLLMALAGPQCAEGWGANTGTGRGVKESD